MDKMKPPLNIAGSEESFLLCALFVGSDDGFEQVLFSIKSNTATREILPKLFQNIS